MVKMELGLPCSAEKQLWYQPTWQQKGCGTKWCLLIYLSLAVLKVEFSVLMNRQWTVDLEQYKDFAFKSCLPVSVNRCKVMHKWHDCSDSFYIKLHFLLHFGLSGRITYGNWVQLFVSAAFICWVHSYFCLWSSLQYWEVRF